MGTKSRIEMTNNPDPMGFDYLLLLLFFEISLWGKSISPITRVGLGQLKKKPTSPRSNIITKVPLYNILLRGHLIKFVLVYAPI